MNHIIDVIINKYKLVLAGILIITLPFGYFFAKQTTLNHIDIFFEKDDPDLLFYKKFQETYGNDEMGVIVFKDDTIFSIQNIDIIRKISQMITTAGGVQRVLSLSEVKVPVAAEDMVRFEKIVPKGDLDDADVLKIRDVAMAHELVTQSLVSKDGTTTAILFELESLGSNIKKRAILLKIMDAAKDIAGNAVTLHFSGTPFLEVEINALTKKDNIRFTPITIGIILVIVTLLFRKLSLSFLTLFNIFLIEIWGVGFLTACGESMNMMTVIIPPVLIAIAVADSIHILAHYRDIYLSSKKEHLTAVAETIKDLWLPCLFTSLTTGVGFLSFITTNVRPVRTVGIFTAIGVMFAFLLSVTFLPAALMVLKKRMEKDRENQLSAKQDRHVIPIRPEDSAFTRLLAYIGRFATGHHLLITIMTALILIIAGIGMTRLQYETNFANYLLESNNIKQDILFIEENFGGTVPVELLITAKSETDDFTQPHSLKMLEEIQKEILILNTKYSKSFSIADYIKEINKAFEDGKEEAYSIPGSRMDILDYYELGDEDTLFKTVAPDYMAARVSFFSRLANSKLVKEVTQIMRTYLEEELGDQYSFKFTGSSPLYMVMDKNLRVSQTRSFFSALIVIFMMMGFVCKSFKLTIISMIPNIFPIVCTLGIMGWAHIPLDVSTIMIASITMGIAVDDTIHFLVWFRRHAMSGLDTRSSLMQTYRDTGKPIVITSVVLCAAYLVLITGSISPIIAFGVLAALAMLFALIGDLLIFPALILVFKPDIPHRKEESPAEFLNNAIRSERV